MDSSVKNPGWASVSAAVRATAFIAGAVIILVGISGFLLMTPDVSAGTLHNGPAMSSGLGVWLFAGLLLVVYGLVITRKS